MQYVVLDSARMLDNIESAQMLNEEYYSLYTDKMNGALDEVAPYLFTHASETDFALWLASSGWGESWGMFINTSLPMKELSRHLSKFLLVYKEDGEELYFRFYDPRVLRKFLPTCDESQLKEFFGLIESFMMEDEDPSQTLIFSLKEGKLHTEVTPVEAFLAVNPQSTDILDNPDS